MTGHLLSLVTLLTPRAKESCKIYDYSPSTRLSGKSTICSGSEQNPTSEEEGKKASPEHKAPSAAL
jgi:hypothetical protein